MSEPSTKVKDLARDILEDQHTPPDILARHIFDLAVLIQETIDDYLESGFE